MKVKINGKKTFYDGQTVYLIGGVKPSEFHKFYKDTEQDSFVMNWNDQYRAHVALRRAVKHYLPQMSDWLASNNAVNTFWVDPEIFQSYPSDIFTDYNWGIGFKKDDPLESWFVLRWS